MSTVEEQIVMLIVTPGEVVDDIETFVSLHYHCHINNLLLDPE